MLLFLCLTLAGAVSCGPDSEEAAVTGSAAVPPGPVPSGPPGASPAYVSPRATPQGSPAVGGLSDDGDLAAQFRQAAELARTGLYDRALGLYLRILEERPDHSPTMVNAARIHFIRGRTEEAIEFLKRANQTAPGNPRTLGYLGMAEAKAGQLDNALVHLESSRLIDPSRIDVGSELAGVYFQLERYEEAVEAWGRVLAQDPNSLSARAGLERIQQLSQPADTEQPQP